VTGSLTRAVARLVAEAQDVLALVVLPWECDLVSSPDLRAVREGVRRHLSDAVHPDSLADVLLVVGELVSNAYQHTTSPRRLRVVRDACVVRVEVTDGSPAAPAPHPPSTTRQGGRGLLLVHGLCRDWGVRPAADGEPGKTVWADLAAHPSA